MYRSDCEGYIEEVNNLINMLDIDGADATEIINIYFESFSDSQTYWEFLHENIRIIRDNEENQPMIAELETLDDEICLYEGSDYYLITNYNEMVKYGYMGDVLPNPF